MADFNFADSYRAAGLTPTPESLRLRQEPFDGLRKDLDVSMALDLTRLYFGLPVPNGTDWFRDAFNESDPTFSMYDNQREAAVLAAGLLSAATADGKSYAGLAVLTTSACGLRTPTVRPELVAEVEHKVNLLAVNERKRNSVNVSNIKLPAVIDVSTESAALSQSGDWSKVSSLFTRIVKEENAISKTAVNQISSVVSPLAQEVVSLREEVDMLWWHTGGWSRVLERAFSELPLALASVMAGVDMAELSRFPTGPVASPAILQRTITSGRKSKAGKVTIQEAVDAYPEVETKKLSAYAALGQATDVCPVLTAFAKAHEIGAGTAWHASYARATNLQPSSGFLPLELAIQALRERLLVASLEKE